MTKTKDKQITKKVENQLPEPQLIESRPIEIPTELGTMSEEAAKRAAMTPQDRIKQNAELVQVLAPEIQREHLADIQGKQFMCVGGGIAIANAMGWSISVGKVSFDKEDGVYMAEATMTDGVNSASAIGYVGDDEGRWMKGPKAARNSMVQTRAEAKLCRINFGHLYTLLGAATATPAEEMQMVQRPVQHRQEPPAPSAKKSFSSGDDDWADQKAEIQVDHVSHFNGEGWVLHLIHDMDETVYSTFDDEIKESATAAIGTKKIIAITFKQKGDKRRLTGWDTIPF